MRPQRIDGRAQLSDVPRLYRRLINYQRVVMQRRHTAPVSCRSPRDQQLPITIAILFLWARCRSVLRILSQQLAAKAVDLPRFDAVDDALHAPPVTVISV